MSATISLHGPAAVRRRTHRVPSGAHRPAELGTRRHRPATDATYRRRRAVVGTALAVLVAVGAVSAYDVLAGSGSVPASAAVSQPARTTIIAQPGDSLWAIAVRHRGEVPITHYLDKLVELNGGPSIVAGQAVVLP